MKTFKYKNLKTTVTFDNRTFEHENLKATFMYDGRHQAFSFRIGCLAHEISETGERTPLWYNKGTDEYTPYDEGLSPLFYIYDGEQDNVLEIIMTELYALGARPDIDKLKYNHHRVYNKPSILQRFKDFIMRVL